jgi:hypothetical protein
LANIITNIAVHRRYWVKQNERSLAVGQRYVGDGIRHGDVVMLIAGQLYIESRENKSVRIPTVPAMQIASFPL